MKLPEPVPGRAAARLTFTAAVSAQPGCTRYVSADGRYTIIGRPVAGTLGSDKNPDRAFTAYRSGTQVGSSHRRLTDAKAAAQADVADVADVADEGNAILVTAQRREQALQDEELFKIASDIQVDQTTEIARMERLWKQAQGSRQSLAQFAVRDHFGGGGGGKGGRDVERVVARFERAVDRMEGAAERGTFRGITARDERQARDTRTSVRAGRGR